MLAFLNLGVSGRQYPFTVVVIFFWMGCKSFEYASVSREETHTRVMSIPNCTFGIILQGNWRRGLLYPTWKILADTSGHVAPN